MDSPIQFGRILGSGGRGHVFDAMVEGKRMAIKAYYTKHYCRKELAIYEYLKESGHRPDCLPEYYGPIRLAPDHLQRIESSIRYMRHRTTYRVVIGIERIKGSRLDERIDDRTAKELKSLEKKMLKALLDLHKTAGICHGDIKADNILLLPADASRRSEFVIIDLGEGIIRRDTTDTIWRKACKQDIQALRYIFQDARSRKAVVAGCQLIHDVTSTSLPDVPTCFSHELQIQLSQFLASARRVESVPCLLNEILLAIKQPICALAITLVRALRSFGRLLDARRVLESCVTAEFKTPSFDFQKAKVLQSLGLDSMPYFESTVTGFEALLGADHITTQSCRWELAMQCASTCDTKREESILAGLAKSFGGKIPRTGQEMELIWNVEQRMSLNQRTASAFKTQKRSTDTSCTEVPTKRSELS